ncbi:hypothetical protein ACFLS9_05005 [Bacteroidota bacterium]
MIRKILKLFFIITVYTSILCGQSWKASVLPDTAIVSISGSWTVKLIAGGNSIQEGGAIKITLPNGWLNSPWPEGKLKKLQFEDSNKNHFLAVKSSRYNCALDLSVTRQAIDNQYDRYSRTFVITVTDGELLPGDEVLLHFKNTTPPITSEQHKIAVAIDPKGKGIFTPIESYPNIRILPGTPAKVRIIAPSHAKTGVPVDVKVVIMDQFYNSTSLYRGNVYIISEDSTTVLPPTYHFRSEDNGVKNFPVTFNTPGIHTVKVKGDLILAPHGIESNPVNVSNKKISCNIYWGDLHSHSCNSKDAAGEAETAFLYARDVSKLDFYALTDHGAGDYNRERIYWVGLTAEEWEQNINLVKKYDEPGKFVPLLGSEWSGGAPYGHHNVIYKNIQGMFFGEDEYFSIEEVWSKLTKGDVITIPHHLGIVWPGGSSPYTDWTLNRNDTLRPAMEIYSLWGSSEYYKNSMSYERYHQRYFRSHPDPNYARDVWALGYYLGVVGGSDDHTAHPGKDYGGLTAVCTSVLDRDSVFNAIQNRHTYATTGQRMLLDFRINNQIMGSKIYLEPGETPEIDVKVTGTNIIDFVQVMKFNGRRWIILSEVKPDSRYCTFSYIDSGFLDNAIFYVRIKQKNIVENREVRGWSSPIWVFSTE